MAALIAGVLVGNNSSAAAASPDATSPGAIVFESGAGAANVPFHLYTLGSDGEDLNRTAPDTCVQQWPRWSPDGRRVAFGRCNGIAVASADGADVKMLTSPPNGEQDSAPAWSWDGTSIAFSRYRNNTSSIWVVDADGSNPREIISEATTPGVGDFVYAPSWSPDGASIVFVKDSGSTYEIWSIGVDGSAPRFLVGGHDVFVPSWSPNGQRIVYHGTDAQGLEQIFVADVPAGSGPANAPAQLTTAGRNKYPAWSPDGSSIVFASSRDGDPTGNSNNEIYTMRADGTAQTRITTNSVEDSFPSWSSVAQPSHGAVVVRSSGPALFGTPIHVPEPGCPGPARSGDSVFWSTLGRRAGKDVGDEIGSVVPGAAFDARFSTDRTATPLSLTVSCESAPSSGDVNTPNSIVTRTFKATAKTLTLTSALGFETPESIAPGAAIVLSGTCGPYTSPQTTRIDESSSPATQTQYVSAPVDNNGAWGPVTAPGLNGTTDGAKVWVNARCAADDGSWVTLEASHFPIIVRATTPPPPPAPTNHIKTNGSCANVRTGPGTNYGVVTCLPNGTAITIECQVRGGPAYTTDGRASYIWDRLTAPNKGNYVSDIVTDTPNFNSFSPGFPQCDSGGGGSPPPPPPAATSCASFVSDVTIPDGANVAPGTTFTKVWRFRNCGNTNWSELTAQRSSGSFGPASFKPPVTQPGATGDFSISMTAPSATGHYRSTYRLVGPSRVSGSGSNQFWADINVVRNAPPPPSPPTGSTYVALGDSYSSGEGSYPYYAGSDSASPYNQCHRSPDAYGARLSRDVAALNQWFFAACSGAQTDDLFVSNPRHANEPAQLSRLGTGTKVVTLTIGGNDLGFAGVLQACIYARGPAAFFNQGDPGCSNSASVTSPVASRMNSLAGNKGSNAPDGRPIHSIPAVLDEIHRRAPNARIFIGDYPRLLGTTISKNNACYVGVAHVHNWGGPGTVDDNLYIDEGDISWLNSTGAKLDRLIMDAANSAKSKGVPVTFVEYRNRQAGHGICDTKPNWIRTAVVDVDHADHDRKTVDPGSFHPTVDGQIAYEGAFRDSGIG